MGSYPKKKRGKTCNNNINFLAVLLLIFSIIFSLINLGSDKIISGVSINNIEVSGLTKEEAKGKLTTLIEEKKKKELSLKYNDYSTEINPELIEVNYHMDDSRLMLKHLSWKEIAIFFQIMHTILSAMCSKRKISI